MFRSPKSFLKTRVLRRYFRSFLLTVLSFQLFMGPHVLAQNTFTHQWMNESGTEEAIAKRVGKGTLHMVNQVHHIIDKNSGELIKSYQLNEPSLLNPFVGIANIFDLEIKANRDKGEIEILLEEGDVIHKHIISGFGKITADPVMKDAGNFVVFANAEDGVYAIPLRIAKTTLYKAPIPIINILPSPPQGGEITAFDFFNFEGSEEQLKFLDGLDESEVVFKGDLGVTIEYADHTEPKHVHLFRRDITLAVATQLQFFLLFGDVLARSSQQDPTVVKIIEAHADGFSNFLKAYGQLIEEKVGDKQDLVQEAFAQFARRGGREILEQLLRPNGGEKNAFERLAYAPRDGMTVGQFKGSLLERARNNYELTQEEKVEFQEKVGFQADKAEIQYLKKTEESVKEYMEQPGFLKRMAQRMKNSVGKAGLFLTGGVLGVGAGAAIYSIDQVTEATYNILTSAIELYGTTPLPELVDKAMTSAAAWAGSFTDTYTFGLWAGMLTSLLALQRMAIWASSLLKIEEAKNMTTMQKFFTIGIRVLARLNNVFTVLWESGLKQKLLYASEDHGLHPLTKRSRKGVERFLPSGFHSPLMSDKKLNERAKQVQGIIKERTSIKQLASYLSALAVVSYEESQKQGAKVDAVSLVVMDQLEEQIKAYHKAGYIDKSVQLLDMLNETEYLELWDKVFPYVYSQLLKYIDSYKGVDDSSFDRQSFLFYQTKFKKILKKVHRTDKPTLTALLKNRWDAARIFFSHKAVPYLVWGSAWRNFSLNWRHGVAGSKDAEVAANAVLPDYSISMALGAVLYPEMHSDAAAILGDQITGNNILADASVDRLSSASLPWVMGGEQTTYNASVGFYGAAAAESADLFPEPFGSRSQAWMGYALGGRKDRKEIGPEAGALSREHFGDPNLLPKAEVQTAKDALGRLKRNFNLREYLEEHGHFIEKITGETVMGNLLIGAPFIAAGFVGSSLLLGGINGVGDLAATAGLGLLQNFYILMMKYGFLGYAFLWPYIHIATRQGAGYVRVNQAELDVAVYSLELGSRVNDKGILTHGVDLMKKAFEKGGKKLPERLLISNDNYTPELGRELLKYSFQNPPLPTKKNPTVFVGLVNSGIGAVGTTVLYFTLYTGALGLANVAEENGMGAAWGEFADRTTFAISFLVGTYVAVRHGPKMISKETRELVWDATLRTYIVGKEKLSKLTQKGAEKIRNCARLLSPSKGS